MVESEVDVSIREDESIVGLGIAGEGDSVVAALSPTNFFRAAFLLRSSSSFFFLSSDMV